MRHSGQQQRQFELRRHQIYPSTWIRLRSERGRQINAKLLGIITAEYTPRASRGLKAKKTHLLCTRRVTRKNRQMSIKAAQKCFHYENDRF